MKVPLLDLRCQYLGIREGIRQALDHGRESQQFILGPRMETLNNPSAAYSGCGHAVGVSPGTNDPTAGGTVMNGQETES